MALASSCSFGGGCIVLCFFFVCFVVGVFFETELVNSIIFSRYMYIWRM